MSRPTPTRPIDRRLLVFNLFVLSIGIMNNYDIYHNVIYEALHRWDMDHVKRSGNHLILDALSNNRKPRNLVDYLLQNQNG